MADKLTTNYLKPLSVSLNNCNVAHRIIAVVGLAIISVAVVPSLHRMCERDWRKASGKPADWHHFHSWQQVAVV